MSSEHRLPLAWKEINKLTEQMGTKASLNGADFKGAIYTPNLYTYAGVDENKVLLRIATGAKDSYSYIYRDDGGTEIRMYSHAITMNKPSTITNQVKIIGDGHLVSDYTHSTDGAYARGTVFKRKGATTGGVGVYGVGETPQYTYLGVGETPYALQSGLQVYSDRVNVSNQLVVNGLNVLTEINEKGMGYITNNLSTNASGYGWINGSVLHGNNITKWTGNILQIGQYERNGLENNHRFQLLTSKGRGLMHRTLYGDESDTMSFTQVFDDTNCPISKAETGYCRLVNGLIIQWGKTLMIAGNQRVTDFAFPVSFTETPKIVTSSDRHMGATGMPVVQAFNSSDTPLSKGVIQCGGGIWNGVTTGVIADFMASWIAIGY